MKNTHKILCLLPLMFMAASICGCVSSGKYGRFTLAGSGMTIQQLVTHWEDYNISYAGVNKDTANAILFDPKGDDKVITLHKFWAPVKDKSELTEIIDWMDLWAPVPPSIKSDSGIKSSATSICSLRRP